MNPVLDYHTRKGIEKDGDVLSGKFSFVLLLVILVWSSAPSSNRVFLTQ